MNRLENLKNSLAEKHYKETGHVPTEWAVMNFFSGFEAASAEYEKIIAELEGALEIYGDLSSIEFRKKEDGFMYAKSNIGTSARRALQKLKEFRGGE